MKTFLKMKLIFSLQWISSYGTEEYWFFIIQTARFFLQATKLLYCYLHTFLWNWRILNFLYWDCTFFYKQMSYYTKLLIKGSGSKAAKKLSNVSASTFEKLLATMACFHSRGTPTMKLIRKKHQQNVSFKKHDKNFLLSKKHI